MRAAFELHHLDDQGATFLVGELPPELRLDAAAFDALWAIHPPDFHEIKMHGKLVKTPRWQQAYGADYHYTGTTNRALPVPAMLEPHVAWVRAQIDERMNGLLLNWYDAAHKQYIGKHRDSIANMAHGAPIVTISFGAERTFRLRPWRKESADGTSGLRDFAANDGSVFVMSWQTNRTWTHEVPHSAKHAGRRISLTLRAFTS